jgi:hypothetical protein
VLDPTPCSDVSRALDEPLCGTASRVRSWLLIEQPGEWGRDAVIESDLGEDLGRAIKEAAAPHGLRPVLLRRPDGGAGSRTHAYLCFSGMDDRWALRLDIDSPRDLLDIDYSPLHEGVRPSVGTEHERPIYLVCTHAMHDPCCGRRGVQVARALGSSRPDETWEVSHIGGDRFAANLVCLPHGLYFGRVSDPQRTAELYESARIDLPHFRGRSCYEPVVQAAEVMLRNRDRIDGIDDLIPEERIDHGRRESTLVFTTSSGETRSIRLRVERAGKRRLTCEATNPGRPRAFIEIASG